VPAAIARQQLGHAARHRPGFLDPVLGYVAGEDVVELAAADRVADHMAFGSDPTDIFVVADGHGFPGTDPRWHAIDRHDAAPRHLLRVAALLHAEQAVAHRRV